MKWGESGRSVVMAGSLYKYVKSSLLLFILIKRILNGNLILENYLKNHSFSREKPFLKNVRYPLEWPWVTPQDTKTISYQIEYLM